MFPRISKNYKGGTLGFNATHMVLKMMTDSSTDFVTANAYKEGTKEMTTTVQPLKYLQMISISLKQRVSPFSGDLSTRLKAAAVKQVHGSGGARKALLFIRNSGSTPIKHLQKISTATTSSGSGTAITSIHQQTGIPVTNM